MFCEVEVRGLCSPLEFFHISHGKLCVQVTCKGHCHARTGLSPFQFNATAYNDIFDYIVLLICAPSLQFGIGSHVAVMTGVHIHFMDVKCMLIK